KDSDSDDWIKRLGPLEVHHDLGHREESHRDHREADATLAVREGLRAKSAVELVAMAKRAPGKYTIASSGPGTIVQMAAELIKQQARIDLLVVPFKAGSRRRSRSSRARST